jgi:cyclophilin family peptidyl-prolyl cis-trans isomerase
MRADTISVEEETLMRIMRFAVCAAALAALAWPRMLAAEEKKVGEESKEANPVVIMETSLGTIKIELWASKAPETVKNFLRYVDDKHFDGTIFHRVIDGFMIQGGGFTKDMTQKPTRETIKNEATADKKNTRGTLAMARTSDVNSATAQFFINVVDNASLDHRDETARGFGYCAFGKVIGGMDVVDKIKKVATGTKGQFENVPVEPVEIKSVRREGKTN